MTFLDISNHIKPKKCSSGFRALKDMACLKEQLVTKASLTLTKLA